MINHLICRGISKRTFLGVRNCQYFAKEAPKKDGKKEEVPPVV